MPRHGNGNILTQKPLVHCRRCRSKTVKWEIYENQKVCVKCIAKDKKKVKKVKRTERDLEYRIALYKHKGVEL